jgi:hypothetical protein
MDSTVDRRPCAREKDEELTKYPLLLGISSLAAPPTHLYTMHRVQSQDR